MAEINNVTLTGNLVFEPEATELPSGTAKLGARIAVDEPRRAGVDENGEAVWETRTNFFDVEMFGRRAESRAKRLRKGSKVAVSGRLRYDQWEDRETGGKRSKVVVVADEIVAIGPKRDAGEEDGERELTREEVDAQFAAIPRVIAPDMYGYEGR